MPEQLDIFSTIAEQETDPVKKASAMLLERRLKPPAVIMQNHGPEIVTLRGLESQAPIRTETGINREENDLSEAVRVKTEKTFTELPVASITVLTNTAISAPISIIAVKTVKEEKPKSQRGRKSIKEMSMEADLPEVPNDEKLFSKQYYGIGEVAIMFHVNASLLRYWESEFDILKPKKNGKGDRFFRPDDIKNLQVIHHLLRQKKFTIEGAKDYLRNNKQLNEKFEMIKQLQQIKDFLLEMKAGL